jgi:hypothetical protein
MLPPTKGFSYNANRFNRTGLNKAFEHLIIHRQTAEFVLVQDTQRRDSIVESSSLPCWQRSCVLGWRRSERHP